MDRLHKSIRVIRFLDENGVERYGEEPAAGTITAAVLEGSLFATSRPLVFAGPSGAGKGTLIAKLEAKYAGSLGFSVSHTTRAPRPGEVNGKHYHFTTREAMQQEIDRGAFLEYADVHGKFYGTSSKAVADVGAAGKIAILDIDIQGVKSVKTAAAKAGWSAPAPLYVFVEPPSLAVLEARLRGRGTEKEEAIVQRLANAEGEMAYGAAAAGHFDLNLVNDDLEDAFGRLTAWLEDQYPELANYPLPCNGLRRCPRGTTATVAKLLSPLGIASNSAGTGLGGNIANILCVGLNYKAHAAECGMPLPERPVIFMKVVAVLASSAPSLSPAFSAAA